MDLKHLFFIDLAHIPLLYISFLPDIDLLLKCTASASIIAINLYTYLKNSKKNKDEKTN